MRTWLVNYVFSELVNGVLYIPTTYQIWKALREGFDTVDETRIFHLHRDFCIIQQGISSMSQYFTPLSMIWDEFGAILGMFNCDCGGLVEFTVLQENMKLFQAWSEKC